MAKTKNTYPTKSNITAFKRAQKDLDDTYNTEQQKYILKQIDKISYAATSNQSSLEWQNVNKFSGRKTSPKSKQKASSEKKCLDLWKGDFQSLLGSAPVITDKPVETIVDHDLDITQGNFNIDELIQVLEKLKTRKASGHDDIPPKTWKTGAFMTFFWIHAIQSITNTPLSNERKAVFYHS